MARASVLPVAAGEASELETEHVRRHAASCPDCHRRLVGAAALAEALRADAASVREAARVRGPWWVVDRVHARLGAARGPTRKHRPALGLGAAAAAYLAGASCLLTRIPWPGAGLPAWAVVGVYLALAGAVVLPLLYPRPAADEQE